MSQTARNFCWYELMTSDASAADAFYRAVIGWTTRDAGMPDMKYTLISANGVDVAGLMEITSEMRENGMRPVWMGHISVENVDQAAAAVKAAGGSIYREPMDIPNNIGRFSVVADPQGAAFLLFQSKMAAPKDVPLGTIGHFGWHELFTTDNKAGFDFYAGQFGWTKTREMDMGAMGTYDIFAINGVDSGGMMNKPADMPRPMWQYYINVDAIDAAAARVTQNGGKILMGPHEVPGPMWVVQCFDPQGALFAMVAPKR